MMRATVQIDSDAGVIYRTITGKGSAVEFMESSSAILEHPDFRPGMRALIDLRGMEPSTFRPDLVQVAQFLMQHRQKIGALRAAVVVQAEASFGSARELAAELQASPIEIAVFRNMSSAKKWLGIDFEE
jgi:hypothetical protein